jgi:hypothetical protein
LKRLNPFYPLQENINQIVNSSVSFQKSIFQNYDFNPEKSVPLLQLKHDLSLTVAIF